MRDLQLHKETEFKLTEQVLQWVVNSVDPEAEVLAVRQLHGGMSSLMAGVSLRTGQSVRDYVLRQFTNEEWLEEEPDAAVHEAESLRKAVRTGLKTPRLAAYEPTGSACGLPVVLMSQLDGEVVLSPADQEVWLDGMANTLAQIHAAEADEFAWSYFTYQNIQAMEIPDWSPQPDMWKEIIRIVQGSCPDDKLVFIHRDYHAANILWHNNQVSGVVDWVNACRGPAGVDVGHCRVDLAQLHGVETADRFLSAYERHAGSNYRHNVYWDMVSLIDVLFGTPTVYPGWTALGVSGLTDQLIMERLDNYAASLLARL
jgi:aminoglycoside phosphotransferase (APT) family kinase protein